MAYTPDVPTTSLQPNEFNEGLNVETDVRGIRSVAGDLEILTACPGTPTFISSGFRQSGEYWFIVATTEGNWYATNGTTQDWYDITPTEGVGTYAQNTNITESWNGTIPFFNDAQNPPMFFPDEPYPAKLVMYKGLIQPANIYSLTVGVSTVVLEFGEYDAATNTINPYTYATAPYVAGDKILITGVNNYYNGIYTVASCTDSQVEYIAVPGAAPPILTSTATVSSAYTWNYNPNWQNYYANFMRLYSTPNVGSILVAGNLTVTTINDTTEIYPVTVQWSQAFGLNQAPLTWQPTITNVANQLEVPLRGPALDAFPCNGQFFLCSYWDTVVFSPLNYSTTSLPILGVRLYNQGRGLLSSNCWANTDKLVYGVDARDIWVFDGTDFQGLGNQKVKNWFFDQLSPQYYDRVFMEVNSQKNQVEIYYPDSEAIDGVPNKMLSYRYDLQIWNAPRTVSSATFSCESPIWTYNENTSQWEPNLGSRTIVYARGQLEKKLVQKDYGYTDADGNPIYSYFKRSNIKLLKDYSGKLMVHRLLPEINNLGGEPFTGDYNKQVDPTTSTHKGNVTVTISGANSVGSTPVSRPSVSVPTDSSGDSNTTSPWAQIDQNAYRVTDIKLENTSDNDIWMCSATTWQYTQVEDDR
jgi:hypothetical protein